MAVRYTPDELKFLRDSPLVSKPSSLPPAEQWMGPPADASRNSTKPTIDRAKSNDSNLLLDQPRRPVAERHLSRNSANPEDIILGPPRTAFMSATSARNVGKPPETTDRPPLRDSEIRDRYSFRNKAGEGEGERTRDNRNNNLRPKRAEGDQDSDGWSTVKPRKSFGTEGAERFNGRMGGDRHREDRRFKDREEVKEKARGFDSFSRDKDNEHDQERDNRRNGTGRGRNEPSWFKDREASDAPPTPRDRNSNGDRFVDRSRGWREKERDDNRGERIERNERGDRGDRRWDRDRNERQEREPEWMDEPAEEKTKTNQIKTAEDFQKWKEQMQGKDKTAGVPMDEVKPDEPSFFGLEKQKVETPLEINNGPDKFFGMWSASKDGITPDEPKMEGIPKSKTVGKASRFTSFFTPQEEPQRRVTEPPPPPPPTMPGGLGALFLGAGQNNSSDNGGQSAAAEKEAFQNLLQKLQHQTVSGPSSTPPIDALKQPKPPAAEKQRSHPLPAPEPYQQYRSERPDEPRPSTRNSQQSMQQELLSQRQLAGSQPIVRPEQMLQDLVGQRHNAMSQPSSRPDQPLTRNTNTEFLMGLMQSARAAPEPQRSEQMLLRMPPRTVDRQMQQQVMEREQELQREAAQRERSASQRQARPPPPPPGFISFDDAVAFQRGPPPQHERQAGNPPQPTQILQRPPPPGLEMGWDRQPQLPPQHRIAQNIAPPPGLANGPNRGMPMPQGIYPPGFPMGAFPPPEIMAGPPRNMQMQPPPGFFNPPPPGFMPPGMSGFQGPEGMAFGAPFDGRGPPHQGTFRRQ